MMLWGIDVAPKDINIIMPNYSDFDKVREHFYKFAIRPVERCENWLMRGLGDIFFKALLDTIQLLCKGGGSVIIHKVVNPLQSPRPSGKSVSG